MVKPYPAVNGRYTLMLLQTSDDFCVQLASRRHLAVYHFHNEDNVYDHFVYYILNITGINDIWIANNVNHNPIVISLYESDGMNDLS